ncbi:DUF6247 family protein [Actinomycetospora soli]|uniref:DUF6247 family protein n=1 Tax=Actinomycetospora soli TaxID=2893887 RepID=UPI001E4E23EB|nr:DUF6247 family protein [Actinomycetospora soli]MCD2191707.1 DUF6247 family protein [Actinomycetospora soli]
MTAAARRDPEPHPLALGASPAVIRQRLVPDDAARFVAAYEAALNDARTSLDLAGVHELVERWRGIAILQTDPAAYRRTIRRSAELATGQPSPEQEPLDVTTTKAGL